MNKNYTLLILALFCNSGILFSQNKSSNIYLRDSLKNILLQETQVEKRYDIFLEICNTFVYSIQPDSIAIYNDSMHTIAQRLQKDSLIGTAYAYTGVWQAMKNQIKEAMSSYFLSLKYLEDGKSQIRKSFVYKQIAIEFRNISDIPSSISYLSKAKEFLPVEGILPNRVYTNLADAYVEYEKMDSALMYSHKALEITKANVDPYGYGRSLYLLGRSYLGINEPLLGVEYLNKCIAFCEKEKIFTPLRTSQITLAEREVKQGLYENAKNRCLLITQLGNSQVGEYRGLNKAYEILQLCYEKENKKDSFLIYFNHSTILDSVIRNTEFLNSLHNLQVQQLIFEKDAEEKRIIKNQIKIKQIQFAGILFLIIIMFLVLLFLSKSFIGNRNILKFVAALIILTTFELINVIFHEFFEKITHHNPFLMLILVTLLAILLVPVRKKFQASLNHYYNKWHQKAILDYTKKYAPIENE